MFLHLGGDMVVCTKDIIAILDMESTLKSKHSRDFLNTCEEEGFIIKVASEEPRSFVITERVEASKNNNRKSIRKIIVYYSPISALTLQKRADFLATTE